MNETRINSTWGEGRIDNIILNEFFLIKKERKREGGGQLFCEKKDNHTHSGARLFDKEELILR